MFSITVSVIAFCCCKWSSQ